MNQVRAGIVLNYVIIFINILVGLLYTPYMLEKMGQSEFGLYSLVASVISYLAILDLGLGNAIIRYTAKLRAERKLKEQYELFGMFLFLYTIIAIITLCLGLCLYYNVENMFGDTMSQYEVERAKVMVILLVINLAFTFPMSIFGSIITAYEDFVFAKSVNIIRLLLNTLVMIVLLAMGYKAIAMIVVQTIFNITTLIINFLYCKYKIKIKILFSRFDWRLLKEIAIYSFWIFLNIIMDRIYWSTGQFVLGIKIGTTAVAIFAVAIQLQQMYMTFSTAISSVFLPRITAMIAQGAEQKEISDIFIRTGRLQYVIISTLLSGFIVFGQSFISLWAGEEYNEAYIITLLFFISLTIPLIQNLGITILQARNQMKFRSILYLVIAIVSLVFQIILSDKYGIVGCALAISIALLVGQGLIMNIYYHYAQHIDIPKFWREILKMSIAPVIISWIFIQILQDVDINTWGELSIAISTFLMIYVPAYYFIGLNSYEQGEFKKLFTGVKSKLCR